MKRVMAGLVLCGLAAVSLGARVKVTVDYDKNANFTTLKTWSWPADKPGQIMMALTQNDNPEALRVVYEPMIVAAAEQALVKKGFVKAAAGQPADFLVAYYALVSTNMSAQTIGQFLPSTLQWGLPPLGAATQSLKVVEQGSLVFDVMTPDKHPMWRGLAQAEMHRERPLAQREKRVHEAVADILKQFPPKPKR